MGNGQWGPSHFKHIIINNGAHESVGGQPTVGFDIELSKVGLAVGYTWAAVSSDEHSVRSSLHHLMDVSGPALVEVRVACISRSDLGRPTTTPIENKTALMEFISNKV